MASWNDTVSRFFKSLGGHAGRVTVIPAAATKGGVEKSGGIVGSFAKGTINKTSKFLSGRGLIGGIGGIVLLVGAWIGIKTLIQSAFKKDGINTEIKAANVEAKIALMEAETAVMQKQTEQLMAYSENLHSNNVARFAPNGPKRTLEHLNNSELEASAGIPSR